MAYALNQSAIKIREYDFSSEPVEKLQADLEAVLTGIDQTQDALHFTPEQTKALKQGVQSFVSDLVSFKRDVVTEGGDEYIRTHLGEKFSQIPKDAMDIDSKTYPGAVVVRIHQKEFYDKIAPADSRGLFSPTLGTETLAGRIILVRGEKQDEQMEYHEYLHFLTSKLKRFETMPNKAEKADETVDRLTEKHDAKLDTLDDKLERLQQKKYQEMRTYGKVSEQTRKELQAANQRIDEIENSKDTIRYFTHAEINTYETPEIVNAFNKVKDEIQSYTLAQNEIPQGFISATLGIGLADTLAKTPEGKLFIAELGALKEVLNLAKSTDLDPNEIGFLVSGSRSLLQATKFVYIHLQQAPKKFKAEVLSKVDTEQPSQPMLQAA
jgi:hypothetical protein